MIRRICIGSLLCIVASAAAAEFQIIAHRGASGDRPEHTLAAYALAVEQGAHFIEPDLVPTRDGVLIARHEPLLAADTEGLPSTTNAADLPAFVELRSERTIYGSRVSGWYSEDFTLDQIKTLRARERMPEHRPANVAYNDRFEVPTFAEVLALAERTGVGVYPELKTPTYFAQRGIDVVALFVRELKRTGFAGPLIVQCFERDALLRLRAELGPDAILVQLSREVPDLADVATYANGVGLPIEHALTPGFIMSAQIYGLAVHPFTLRAEAAFLPGEQSFEDVLGTLVRKGASGVFTDHPGRAKAALP